MKVRIPLSVKIIGWFFLNLAVLAVAAWFLLRDRFAFSMLASRTAGDRVAEIARQITAELPAKSRQTWNDVLRKYSEKFHIDFYLYTNDGVSLAGPPQRLPPEVHSKLIGAVAPPAGQPPAGDGRPPRNGPPDEGPPQNGPQGGRPPRRDGPPPRGDRAGLRPGDPGFGPPGDGEDVAFNMLRGAAETLKKRVFADRILVQTQNPERYWVFARVKVNSGSSVLNGAIIASSDSPTGHGLYFDPSPLLWAGAGALALTALVWFPLIRSITRSIAQMRTATGRLAEGQFDARVREDRRDELGELGTEINRMATRLSGYVDGQRRFLGDVAHELCAPVARLQMAVGILEQNAKSPAEQERLSDVREEVEHMSGLVNELLQFTRATVGGKKIEVQPCDLRPIVERAIRREAVDESAVRNELPADIQACVAPDLLQRAISNLVRNALRYAGHAGQIVVSALRDGDEVFLSVTDQGPGVPEDTLQKLFDPFFRVDTARTPGAPGGGGTGLGLAIVKTCVEACGGGVSVRNVSPGLEVTLRLPAAQGKGVKFEKD